VGVLHGNKTYLLQDETGQIRNAHSISAGLDYPGVGPEHAWLRDSGRATYVTVTDDEAVEALRLLTATEGIIPALESAHAIAHAVRLAPRLDRRRTLLVNLSGRGDKDRGTVAAYLGVQLTCAVSARSWQHGGYEGRRHSSPTSRRETRRST